MILDSRVIKGFIPFIGTSLILCGYAKLSIYYSYFNIRINDYIELTEVLTLFLTDIIYYGSLMFVGILFIFLIEEASETEWEHNQKQALIDSTKIGERFKKHYLFNQKLVLTVLIFSLIHFAQFVWFRKDFWYAVSFTAVLPAMLVFNVIMLEFRHKYKQMQGVDFNSTYNNLIGIFFFFSIYSIISAYRDIENVESGRGAMNVKFEYEKEEIKSNENLVYLGQTKNYLFLHDKNIKNTKVFDRNKIIKYNITQSNKANATNQINDILIYNSDTLSLPESPLE